MSEVDMNFDRNSDVPPEKAVPAGYHDGIVAGVQFEKLDKALGSLPEGTDVARIQYRLDGADNPELAGKYVRPFPIPVRGHKDAWRWFDWCKRMGYDTSGGFQFREDDVVNVPVTLKFGPPKTSKDGSKEYDNLESVERKR